MIVTEAMVTTAIRLVEPLAREILSLPNAIWGPTWVEGKILVPGLPEARFQYGTVEMWDPKWGEPFDLAAGADSKCEAALRVSMDTRAIINLCPWLLEDGDLMYPGGVYRHGIACGISGASSSADEGIACLVIETIAMLSRLEVQHRQEIGQMRV